MTNEAIEGIADVGREVIRLDRLLAAAVEKRDNAVRAAVDSGEKMTVVARAAGISRQRVKQIMVAA